MKVYNFTWRSFTKANIIKLTQEFIESNEQATVVYLPEIAHSIYVDAIINTISRLFSCFLGTKKMYLYRRDHTQQSTPQFPFPSTLNAIHVDELIRNMIRNAI